MINTVLFFLKDQLNNYLNRSFNAESSGLVVLSNLSTSEGGVADNTQDKVVIQLIRVEKDSLPYRDKVSSPSTGGVQSSQPIFLNLYVLVAANFSAKLYPEALTYLSAAIDFFQSNRSMDASSHSNLPRSLNKLSLEIENIGPHDLSSVWGMLGAKYMPSVIYKIRTVSLGGNQIGGRKNGISTPQNPNLVTS